MTVKGSNGHRRWTQAEHDFIRGNIESMTDWEIAKALGRTYEATHSRRKILKCHRSKEVLAKHRAKSGADNPMWKHGGYAGNQAKKRARVKSPDKMRAREIARTAIKRGKVDRLPCEVCGAEKVDAHHDDYSKPLDIRWLCRKHHAEHHKNMRKAS